MKEGDSEYRPHAGMRHVVDKNGQRGNPVISFLLKIAPGHSVGKEKFVDLDDYEYTCSSL
jgi:hypothetical protein